MQCIQVDSDELEVLTAPLNSFMKLSLVFNVLASIVVLATAYPTLWQGPVAKCSSGVEKREDLNSDLFAYYYYNEKREELNSDLIADVSKPESLEEGKRKELDSDLFGDSGYDHHMEEGKREELDSDLFGYSGYDHHMEEGKREELDSDLFWYIYDSRIAAGGEALGI
ncbi:hypothetical protein EDD22DRAFT_880366 [Suillus occidentalis]|nr:hypothetical protein EDD22DRAFT_880366 [Suillus occidentalis]